MKRDLLDTGGQDLLVAASLLTRLPLPDLPATAFDNSQRAVWAYPMVGALVGGLAAMIGGLLLWLDLQPLVAAGVAIAALMMMTGAMHEDGLADMADGVWGGWTRERRLEIMKDSRIGTYGVLALVMTTGLRWGMLAQVLSHAPLAYIAVAALSRAAMPFVMATLPHARTSGLAHSVGRPSPRSAVVGGLLALAFAVLVAPGAALACGLAVAISTLLVRWIAETRLGGQTGDVLGATQQVCEVAALVVLSSHLA